MLWVFYIVSPVALGGFFLSAGSIRGWKLRRGFQTNDNNSSDGESREIQHYGLPLSRNNHQGSQPAGEPTAGLSRRAQTSSGEYPSDYSICWLSIWVRICQISFAAFNSRKVLVGTIVGCVIDSNPPPAWFQWIIISHSLRVPECVEAGRTFGFPIQPNLSLSYLLD